MSVEQKVLLLSLLLRKKRKQRRRVWVHPITSARLTEGCHCLLFKELEDDPIKFSQHCRPRRATRSSDIARRVARGGFK